VVGAVATVSPIQTGTRFNWDLIRGNGEETVGAVLAGLAGDH
jgi:hypothetical protein